jgi:penicillin amidase
VLAGAGDPVTDSLKQQVTIYRDRYGVPHIVGETEPAAFFGYGYAQAQDHLKRMMLQYRDAQGRRSEILGPAAFHPESLRLVPGEYRWGGDSLQRLLRTWQCVIDNRNKIDPHVYELLDAFARGVNLFISEHRAQLPSWIDRVRPEDVEALERAEYMRFYSINDALSKLPNHEHSFPNFGSNQWAISPQLSANGRIIHVENVHMPWSNHFQLYEAQLIVPGKLNVAGAGWFGSPFFLVGFNSELTWSVTWNQPNISDVYEEVVNPANQAEYLYEGSWRKMRVEWASIRVKHFTGMKTERLPLYYTHHGPVVYFDPENQRAYSVKLPNFDGVNYSTGLYRLMSASDLSSFKRALSDQLIPRWNFLYTDKENLYWVHNGLVARRNAQYNWLKPVPGWTKDTEWDGYLPFSDNPQILNPVSGFIQNCNNPPWVVTRRSGLMPLAPVPYYLSYPAKADAGEEVLNARGERVFGVLTRPHAKFTLDQMTNLATDTYVLAADVIVPLLKQAHCNRQPLQDRRMDHAVKVLAAWDRRTSKDSVAYTYLFYWARAYRDLFSDSDFARFTSYRRNTLDISSSREQERAWRSLEAALNQIQNEFKHLDVPWGEINVVRRGETLPLDGTNAFDVLHPDFGPAQADGRIFCNDGWGHLMVAMEGDPKQVWTLLPYGESEDPKSPHYNDQAKLHSDGKLKPFWFTPAEILDNTEAVWGNPHRLQLVMGANNAWSSGVQAKRARIMAARFERGLITETESKKSGEQR